MYRDPKHAVNKANKMKRVVMHVDDYDWEGYPPDPYWVVTEADATNLEKLGYKRVEQ